jgi:short-subunit dehydrogenase
MLDSRKCGVVYRKVVMAVDLRGKVIAITGASSGIGAATAVACARAGMAVVLGARRVEKLEVVVGEIRRAGGRAVGVGVDVADAGAAGAFIERAGAEFGPVYAVFANAGYGASGAVHEMGDEALRRMFEVNFFGSLNVIRPALAQMLARQRAGDGSPRGHVLWCSSCLSNLPTPYAGAYSATKAAQHHLGRAMRSELRGQGVQVSTVHPIGTRTEFFTTAAAGSADPRLIDTTDGPFMQDAGVVAERVVRCLRRPRAEVWTGLMAGVLRMAMGCAAVMPNVADPLIGRVVRRRVGGSGA